MDLSVLVSEIKTVVADVASGKLLDAWKDSLDLQQSAIDATEALTSGKMFASSPEQDAELGAAIGELKTCCASPKLASAPTGDAGATPAAGFDPAMFMFFFQAITQLLSMIHTWRHPTPVPPTP